MDDKPEIDERRLEVGRVAFGVVEVLAAGRNSTAAMEWRFACRNTGSREGGGQVTRPPLTLVSGRIPEAMRSPAIKLLSSGFGKFGRLRVDLDGKRSEMKNVFKYAAGNKLTNFQTCLLPTNYTVSRNL